MNFHEQHPWHPHNIHPGTIFPAPLPNPELDDVDLNFENILGLDAEDLTDNEVDPDYSDGDDLWLRRDHEVVNENQQAAQRLEINRIKGLFTSDFRGRSDQV